MVNSFNVNGIDVILVMNEEGNYVFVDGDGELVEDAPEHVRNLARCLGVVI